MKKLFFAELIAGLLIVLIGAGTAAIVAGSTLILVLPVTGLGFFLAVMLVSQSVGHISGGHGNPSITVGHLVAGKLDAKTACTYILAQFIGAVIGGFLIYLALTASGQFTAGATGVLGTNIIPEGMLAKAGLFETIITFVFVMIILLVTSEDNENNHRAPFIIGLALAMLVMLASPITGGSLNAARSFGVAIFERGTALMQFPIFLIFPTIGGALAGAVYSIVFADQK
ncbi:aquaporin [Mollicutes bacterium LVI A0078]|nr:aquaporin [Mollicutes bacterium LVI A0075]WOO91529.1 aquaporin [Mollicutes bacterium LVI A0078]